MSATERWNKIVEIYKSHINDKEEVIQTLWENIFVEFFGYSRFGGEVERHRNIRIGSTERVITDIIIKDGASDLFIVELKQHNLTQSKAMELQLISYLKQLRLETGILVCDKIYIFDYDYGKADDEQDRADIAFTVDNPDGVRFVEMFSKSNFVKSAVKDFIKLQSESIEKIDRIKDELSADLAVELLKKYFSDKYGEVEFAKAVEGFKITVTPEIITPFNSAPSFVKTFSPINSERRVGVDIQKLNKPKQKFVIDGVMCDKNKFEKYLRGQPSVNVRVTLLYHGGQTENKIWRVNNFGAHSNLSGNLASGFLRDWRAKGIVGIELEV